MKIKLKESQYSKIGRLAENSVNIDKVIVNFDKVIERLNKIYGQVMFYNVEDLIKDSSVLDKYLELLSSMDNYRHKTYMDGYEIIEKIPEDEYDSMGYTYDSVLDDKNGDISSKIQKLESFIEGLKKVAEIGSNLGNDFQDFKRIDV